MPPESDGSGFDRKLLKQAYELLLGAGCKRDGEALTLPNGKPLTIEFLDFSSALQPHTMPFIQNLGKLGIQANMRIVDAAQYKSRTDAFDFDVVTQAMGGSTTPGADLRVVYTSAAAAQNGSRNLAGVADPVVDALVETIATAKSRPELNVGLPRPRPRAAGRALLGADVVSRHGLGRLLGRVLPARAPAEAWHRRARHLVVGRREGEGDWRLCYRHDKWPGVAADLAPVWQGHVQTRRASSYPLAAEGGVRRDADEGSRRSATASSGPAFLASRRQARP